MHLGQARTEALPPGEEAWQAVWFQRSPILAQKRKKAVSVMTTVSNVSFPCQALPASLSTPDKSVPVLPFLEAMLHCDPENMSARV